MTPEQIDHLRTMYRNYYHDSIDSLPDGWFTIVTDFLGEMDGIGDLTDAVSVRLERTPSGLKAFVFPEMSRWSNEHMHQLRTAQRTLYGLSQTTCETCGKGAVYAPLVAGRFFCAEHDGGGNNAS
ncbi:hypothetical protein ABIA16_003528 [Sinorhizobium fredii]